MKILRLVCLIGFMFLLGCNMNKNGCEDTGRQKANEMISHLGGRMSVSDAHLGEDDDVAFGGCGFHYFEDKDIIAVRVFIAQGYFEDAKEATKDRFRNICRALNDPKIGGMFECGGGYFVFTEGEDSKFFLVREFLLSNTSTNQFVKNVDELINIGATWDIHWFEKVVDIVNGMEPPPMKPVTRKDLIK